MIAFGTAFMVSFVGHLGFTFAEQDTSLSSALWKFSIVGLVGFCCNEALLIYLLRFGGFSDTTSLFISTGFAALLTFFLSKTWAFRATQKMAQTP